MQDNLLRDMNLFVEVAAHKNFSQAADKIDVPLSTLSRRIARMEKDLGVRLFNRNSRTVKLTESGNDFYDRCKYIVTVAKEAHEALLNTVSNPSGTIRMAVPTNFCQCLKETFIGFAKKYPTIQLDIQEKEKWSDLLTDQFDLEFRIGNLPDSSLVARQLTQLNLAIYAAPELLKKYPEPCHPRDFLHLPCICFSQDIHWTLIKNGMVEEVSVQPAYQLNSGIAIHDFALAGLGFAPLPSEVASYHAKAGKLIPVLRDWHFPEKSVSIVMPSKQPPLRVSLFVDYLIEKKESLHNIVIDFREGLDATS